MCWGISRSLFGEIAHSLVFEHKEDIRERTHCCGEANSKFQQDALLLSLLLIELRNLLLAGLPHRCVAARRVDRQSDSAHMQS
jgi:hypothetical protein